MENGNCCELERRGHNIRCPPIFNVKHFLNTIQGSCRIYVEFCCYFVGNLLQFASCEDQLSIVREKDGEEVLIVMK